MNKVIFLSLIICLVNSFNFEVHSEHIISVVNTDPTSTWVAGHNEYFKGATMERIKHLMGTYLYPHDPNFPIFEHPQEVIESTDIPTNFDPAKKWPNCSSLKEIRDQSNCGSCWAFGSAEAMSDRICIQSGQKDQTRISTEDILSCCPPWICGNGCNGGFPSGAWHWYKNTGVVTGDLYQDNKYCQPYAFPPCEHHVPGPLKSCEELSHFSTPRCDKSCNPQYETSYKDDKKKGKTIYGVRGHIQNIQIELMNNGPITASMSVYEDFLTYKSGVYTHKTGKNLGGHAIKLLGWGETEDGTPYWLLANSWNDSWGDNGYFKIYRGNNTCGIESGLYAGIPSLNDESRIIE